MLKGWLILIIGVGMLLIVIRGLVTGVLPAGRGGWNSPREFHRADQPLLFWLMFVMDLFLAVVCIRYGIRWV